MDVSHALAPQKQVSHLVTINRFVCVLATAIGGSGIWRFLGGSLGVKGKSCEKQRAALLYAHACLLLLLFV